MRHLRHHASPVASQEKSYGFRLLRFGVTQVTQDSHLALTSAPTRIEAIMGTLRHLRHRRGKAFVIAVLSGVTQTSRDCRAARVATAGPLPSADGGDLDGAGASPRPPRPDKASVIRVFSCRDPHEHRTPRTYQSEFAVPGICRKGSGG
jgi:hypothetical protein